MAKKIRYESFVYRFLAEASALERLLPPSRRPAWQDFVEKLEFRYQRGSVLIRGGGGDQQALAFSLGEPEFCRRGDDARHAALLRKDQTDPGCDAVQERNAVYFRAALLQVAATAGIDGLPALRTELDRLGTRTAGAAWHAEESFHDRWALNERPETIDVIKANEALTSPEMRYIRGQLGDLAGRRLLDVGCGLGEASVYFALHGANVTAMDISKGMLDATARLAALHGARLRTHKAAAHRTMLDEREQFDIIYAGNLLHHVDIAKTIRALKPHLAPGGVFASWDPLAYNPVINIYRAIASGVRTVDEHPLRRADIGLLRREFGEVQTRHFWFTTLLIFILMALVQGRNPNRERFWKAVVVESERWAPLYRPLARLDEVLLALLPPLRWCCWNVVFLTRNPLDKY